jgi:hypothetical protein
MGSMRAAIKRKKIRYPVFQVERISNAQFVGLNDCIEPYDSFLKTRRWKIVSKALKPHNLVLLFARDLADDHRMFKAIFDADTFAIVRERILEGKEYGCKWIGSPLIEKRTTLLFTVDEILLSHNLSTVAAARMCMNRVGIALRLDPHRAQFYRLNPGRTNSSLRHTCSTKTIPTIRP